MKNLLFITTDHQRSDSLEMIQCGIEVTPNLNKLAKESINFKRTYTSSPLCVPARTSLATGIAPTNTGVVNNIFPPRTKAEKEKSTINRGAKERSLHQYLFESGYTISHFGGQHISLNPYLEDVVDFKKFITNEDYFKVLDENNIENFIAGHRIEVNENTGDGRVVKEYYSNTKVSKFSQPNSFFRDCYFVDQLQSFINEETLEDPFAIFLNIWAPHPPLIVPSEYLEKFPLDKIRLPKNINTVAINEPRNRRRGIAAQMAEENNLDDWKKVWQAHLALTNLADELIGKVIDQFKRKGIYEDTIIVFTSDHGDHLGQHKMYQKMEMYEQAVRVPLLIKIDSNPKETNVPVSHLDIVPTLLDILGINSDKNFDGESLKKFIIENKKLSKNRFVFSQYSGNLNGPGDIRRMVVNQEYKYIFDSTKSIELFDLINDPLETKNIAFERNDIVQEFHQILKKWFYEKNDFINYGGF